MSNGNLSKINSVLGYSNKFSNWKIAPRKCLPSLEREQYIFYKSNQGVTHITLRLLNRYIDEFVVFASQRGVEEFVQDKVVLSDYEKHLSGMNSINDSTKAVKLSVAKSWIIWLETELKNDQKRNFRI